jgi:Flp pilus assembly pilin Flp
MKRQLWRLWTETDGVLSFEWTLLLTLLTIGIVSGLAAARDAVIDELGDVAEAALSFNQSYSLAPVSITVDLPPAGNSTSDFTFTAAGSTFADTSVFTDCTRSAAPTGQPGSSDGDS